MKILSIRIKNLASLANEHFIDFEAEPLANAGLIAIIGKTGAGKSTILDAMCLALFNRIPRLKDGEGKIKDVDGSELASNSPLTVLRRGTGHGFAELEFIAQDQKHYAVRWELKRARENPQLKLQKIQRTLSCITDASILATSSTQVESQLKIITKLSFEQFTRAVLLAQSEVTAFLKAKDSERGELLEYLTNSNIFGKIGELAYRKTKEISIRREQLNELSGQIDVLTDEQFTELFEQFKQQQQQQQQLEQQLKQTEQQQQWYNSKSQIEQQLNLQEQRLQTEQQKQIQLQPQRNQLTQLEVFANIRPIVFQQQKIQKSLHSIEPQLNALKQQFISCEQSYQQQHAYYQHAELQLNQTRQFEIQHKENLDQIREGIHRREFMIQDLKKYETLHQNTLKQHAPLVQQLQTLEQQYSAVSSEIQQHQQQLDQSHQFTSLDQGLAIHLEQLHHVFMQLKKIEQQHGDLQQLQQQVQTQQQHLMQLQKHASIQDLEQQQLPLRQQYEKIRIYINHSAILQDKLQQWHQYRHDQQQRHTEIDHLKNTIQQLKATTQQLEQEHVNAKIEQEQLEKVLQQQRLLHAENIEKLRANLQENEPCLVCGSPHHPYKQIEHQDLLSKELFQLQQQQLEQTKQKIAQTFDLWQQQLQQLNRSSSHIEQLEQLQQQQQSQSSRLHTDLTNLTALAQITLNFEQTKAQIEENFAQQQQRQQQVLLETQQQIEQLEQQLKIQHQLQQELQQQQSALQQINQYYGQIQSLLSVSHHNNLQPNLVELAQLHQQLQQRQQILKQVQQLSEQMQHIDKDLQEIKTQHQISLEQVNAYQQKTDELKQQGKDNTKTVIQLIHKISFEPCKKPQDWLIQYEQDRLTIEENYQQLKTTFEMQRTQYDHQSKQVAQTEAQIAQLHQQLDETEKHIRQWLIQQPNFDMLQLEQLNLISSEQEQLLRQELQQAKQHLQEAQTISNTLKDQLSQHLQSQPDISFETLQDHFNELTNNLENTSTQLDKLKVQLTVQQQNQEKRAKFADDIATIQQEELRWNKISSVLGDATGKKFRDYAQQYHLDILLEHANQQLQQLSQRYTLQRLENSLSLAIIDHDMDGEIRSVASLSGGESFLTALALSLAIANMASGELKIESLFIDEGFGTLDASSLHVVMDALDRLQSQGRKVVLISHIAEMHERIPVQIQVQPVGSGTSRIQIVG